jgi:hypothetical protein
MKTSEHPTSQRAASTTGAAGVSRKPPAYGISMLDKGRAIQASPAIAHLLAVPPAAGPSEGNRGTPLPDAVSTRMERAFDSNFSSVRVHVDDRAARLGAQAFTRGHDIHFAPGRYDPHGAQGQRLIGHELAHVVQQSQGRVVPTGRHGGVPINAEPALEHEADVFAERAASGRSVGTRGPSRAPIADVVQGFGIGSRTWKDVTAVRNLSKGAYLVSAGGDRLIIKLSGQGSIAIEPGEGPTQETLGAGLARMAGIEAAQTVQITAKDPEARTIIEKLDSLGGEARGLAGMLAKVESFLVMEFVEGADLKNAGRQFRVMSREQREAIYESLGRMYAFDVFIDNTDRLLKLNLGNMMVRTDGVLVGIDQMIQGVTDQWAKLGVSAEAAQSRLAPLLDPKKRRAVSLDLFDSIAHNVEDRFIERDEAIPFALNFEMGVLDMIGRIAALDPERITQTVAQLPQPAQGAVKAVGLSGLGQTHGVFKELAAEAAEQAEQLGVDLRGRTMLDRDINVTLAGLRGEQRTILEFWRAEIAKQHNKWSETEKWMWGAEGYWADAKRKVEFQQLAEFHVKEFELAYKTAMVSAKDVPNSVMLLEQATAWFGGVGELRTELTHLVDSPKKVGEALVMIHRKIGQELRRPSIVFARP